MYSEAAYLDSLAQKINTLRYRWSENNAQVNLSEAVFGDDPTIDNSLGALNSLLEKYPWMKILKTTAK